MKTLTEELSALEKKSAKEAADLRAKHEVLKHLPDIGEYAPPSVHMYALYGAAGSLHFRHQRYSSIAEGKSPDPALLRQLLAAFPPVDALLWRDGSVSFRPEPETYTNNGEIKEIAPVQFRIQPSEYSRTVDVQWWSTVGERLMRFEVEFPMHEYAAKLGTLNIQYVRMFGRGEIRRIESQHFTPANGASYIRYASGDHKTPGEVIVYWPRDAAIDPVAILEGR